MIEAEKANYAIRWRCVLLGVPRSTFYYWKDKAETATEARRRVLAVKVQRVRAHLDDVLASEEHTSRSVRDQLKRERARLEAAEDQCVELNGDPDWPAEKLTERVRDLRLKKAAIDEQLEASEATEARQTTETLLDFLADPRSVYRSACDADRKLLNQICFTALYLERDQHGIKTARAEHAATAAPLLKQIRSQRTRNGAAPEDNTVHENGFHKPMGSDKEPCVHEGGLEPPRPRAQEPKSCASASSATRARSGRAAAPGSLARCSTLPRKAATSVSHACSVP